VEQEDRRALAGHPGPVAGGSDLDLAVVESFDQGANHLG
jgi:hypothetical protein